MPETRAGKLELELKLAEEDYFDHDLTLDNISQDADGSGQGEEDEKEEGHETWAKARGSGKVIINNTRQLSL